MTKRLSCAMLVGFCVACGGGPTTPNTTPPTSVPVASAAPSASSAAPAPIGPKRTPPPALTDMWPFPDSPEVIAYADVAGLTKTELARAAAAEFASLLDDKSLARQRDCIVSVLRSAREVLAGADDAVSHEGVLVLVRFDGKPPTATCASAFGADAAKIEGASEAWDLGHGRVAAVKGDVVAIGPHDLVASVVSARTKGGSVASVGLGDDEYLSFKSDIPAEKTRASGTLLASSERLRLAIDAELPKEEIAAMLESKMEDVKKAPPAASSADPELALLQRFLAGVRLERHGRQVSFTFELVEAPAQQAKDVGAIAAIATFAVRKYLVNAKQAEAKNTIGQVAKDIAMWWEQEDMSPAPASRAKKKLFSLPAVPKTVPRGTKYVSTAADWKAWSKIRFQMEGPQYYQYEVKAAKDGESAEIIAHGDLDGNGKVSTFKIALKVDRARGDMIAISPSITEDSPDE
jgi:hypothetical protein